MKFDGGQGVWPAFWLLPTDRNWPPEIDIMECLGQRPEEVLLTTHWQDSNGQRQQDSSVIKGTEFTNSWHTYAVNWQPQRIDWYVDGVLKKTVTGRAVPSKPMEIIINLAIGGKLPGNADSSTKFPRTAQIDYVKVYAMKQ
jgi:beta-glucanase (GH16 family)